MKQLLQTLANVSKALTVLHTSLNILKNQCCPVGAGMQVNKDSLFYICFNSINANFWCKTKH